MQRILGALIFGAAALLFVGVAAGYADRTHPVLSLVADFRLHLGVVAGALGLAAGIISMRRTSWLAFAAALGAAAGLGPVYDLSERPGAGRAVTLLYANLWDRNTAPQHLKSMLAAIDADILITSETTRAATDGISGLRALYPYRVIDGRGGATLRTAIWSKYPLRRGRIYPDNKVAPTAATATADLGRGLQLGLIGAHFSHAPEGLQQVQANALGPMADALPRPLAIAADFNAAPWSRVVDRTAEVTGTQVLGGHRITWKGHYPTPFGLVAAPWGQQIDHILLSGEIGVEAVETLELPGSDHRGVLVRMRIPLR